MFFEVTIAICYAAHERPHTTKHPFRTEANAHAFIARRIAEILSMRPGWKVLSDMTHTSEYGSSRTVAIAHRNEVRATLRLETRHFEDDLEEALAAPVLPPEAEVSAIDEDAPQPEQDPYAEVTVAEDAPTPQRRRGRHTSKHIPSKPRLHGKQDRGRDRSPRRDKPRRDSKKKTKSTKPHDNEKAPQSKRPHKGPKTGRQG